MRILVTGGAGYIGSHTLVALCEAGHDAEVIDDLSNANPHAVRRVEELTGTSIPLHTIDVLDEQAVLDVMLAGRFDAVIHFAALKAVGESVAQPVRYYQTNVAGSISLIRAMEQAACRTLVFSSSSTVHVGATSSMPLTEDSPLGATNPYGWSKVVVEQVLRDLCAADDRWSVALLRYFNPVGAHPSGRIGEDPLGLPNNLAPFVAQVAVGRLPKLTIFGDDYDTPDGTGVRDYIHVMDLAEGHVAALHHVASTSRGARAWNLGTGQGHSVLELVAAFEAASGRHIPVQTAPRRPGDVPVSFADVSRARRELGWQARRSLQEMCSDAWRWQSANPTGYQHREPRGASADASTDQS